MKSLGREGGGEERERGKKEEGGEKGRKEKGGREGGRQMAVTKSETKTQKNWYE